jgi:hypothetical protein
MAIFNSYVSLPEGTDIIFRHHRGSTGGTARQKNTGRVTADPPHRSWAAAILARHRESPPQGSPPESSPVWHGTQGLTPEGL